MLIDAMEALRHAMLTIRNDLAKAVRAAGSGPPIPLVFHERPFSGFVGLKRVVGWSVHRS